MGEVSRWGLLDNDGKGGDYGVMPYNEYHHWGGMENSPNQKIIPPNGPSNRTSITLRRLNTGRRRNNIMVLASPYPISNTMP